MKQIVLTIFIILDTLPASAPQKGTGAKVNVADTDNRTTLKDLKL